MAMRSQLDTSMYRGMGSGNTSLGEIMSVVTGVRDMARSAKENRKKDKEDEDLQYVNSVVGKYMQGYNGDPVDGSQRKQGAYNEIMTSRPELSRYTMPMQEKDTTGLQTYQKNELGMQNDRLTIDNSKEVLKQNQRTNIDAETKRKIERSMEAAQKLSEVQDEFGYGKVLQDYGDVLGEIDPYYQNYATSQNPATAFWRSKAGEMKQKKLTKETREIEDRDYTMDKGEAELLKLKSEANENNANASKYYNDAKKEKEGSKRNDMFLSKIDNTLRNDTFVKNYTDQLGYAGNTVSLLMSDNPVANQAAKTQLARLSGEVGVLTDRDIERFGGSKAVMSKAKQAATEALNGKLTYENRQFLLAVAQRFEENARLKLDERLNNIALGQSTAFGIPYESIMPLIQSYGSGKMASPSTPAAPTQQAGPKPGDMDEGYVFKGGNPADPNNWELVK